MRELKGFKKVFLQPEERSNVQITVEKKLATSFWDEARNAWNSERGVYEVHITGRAEGTLKATFEVEKTRYWLEL